MELVAGLETGDLLITNQLLYQLSHTSTTIIVYWIFGTSQGETGQKLKKYSGWDTLFMTTKKVTIIPCVDFNMQEVKILCNIHSLFSTKLCYNSN